MRGLCVVVMWLAASVVHAANGWMDARGNCHRTAVDAQAALCSQLIVGADTGLFSCTGLGAAPACADDPAAGSGCNVSVTITWRDKVGPSGDLTRTFSHRSGACELSEPVGLTATKVADYMQLWSLFLLAAVVVLGLKAIYNKFRVDNHGA